MKPIPTFQAYPGHPYTGNDDDNGNSVASSGDSTMGGDNTSFGQ